MDASATIKDKFRGCLLGGLMGDVIGAAVEGESAAYIRKQFPTMESILKAGTIEEAFGAPWVVGRYTDDTQMTLGVAEWLCEDEEPSGLALLNRFQEQFDPTRRYGPGVEQILRLHESTSNWTQLARCMFPDGSYGNGSAMRVAPVGLKYHDNLSVLVEVAISSSLTTHCHPLAQQGAVLQAVAVASAIRKSEIAVGHFVRPLRMALQLIERRGQDIGDFSRSLDFIEAGIVKRRSCRQMASVFGTGVAAVEAVPMALYCFIQNSSSFERTIHDAVSLGGDTDTIASMAGALSGAWLGSSAIPSAWLQSTKEPKDLIRYITDLADRLFGSIVRV
ncbi:MAG: ADP-ribosylglycohydrolase family protein [Verrucomicrobiota bacterium]